jgi:hypothetical protein
LRSVRRNAETPRVAPTAAVDCRPPRQPHAPRCCGGTLLAAPVARAARRPMPVAGTTARASCGSKPTLRRRLGGSGRAAVPGDATQLHNHLVKQRWHRPADWQHKHAAQGGCRRRPRPGTPVACVAHRCERRRDSVSCWASSLRERQEGCPGHHPAGSLAHNPRFAAAERDLRGRWADNPPLAAAPVGPT